MTRIYDLFRKSKDKGLSTQARWPLVKYQREPLFSNYVPSSYSFGKFRARVEVNAIVPETLLSLPTESQWSISMYTSQKEVMLTLRFQSQNDAAMFKLMGVIDYFYEVKRGVWP